MRILFAPLAGAYGIGGITRCLAVAEQSVMRGHEVAFLAPENYPLLDRYPFGRRYEVPRPSRPVPRDGNYLSFAEALYVRGMTQPDYLEAAVAAETEAVERFQPDMIFTEWQTTVAVSGALTGVPFAATVATPDVTRLVGGYDDARFDHVHDAYARLCRSHGVEPAPSVESLLHERAALNVAPTVPTIEPLLAAVPRTRYVGPLLFAPLELAPLPGRVDADGTTHVLVYLGVGTFTVEDLLPELAEAFPAPKHRVTVAASHDRVAGRAVPFTTGHITVARGFGITRALRDTDLLIARGGQNGLMAALLAGVPVIGVPGEHVEPRFNLNVLAAHGAAYVVDEPRASALKEAAQQLRASGAARRARLLGEALRRTGGGVAVVQALEETILTAPVRDRSVR
ncbi:hypothetical protein [Micromonospora sp. NPDC047074]|uniref:glycosyltransferase n=1 Tax=Micromonospora sp. NPDC047074 TaxID=3154339 RepID=UPI00340B4D21